MNGQQNWHDDCAGMYGAARHDMEGEWAGERQHARFRSVCHTVAIDLVSHLQEVKLHVSLPLLLLALGVAIMEFITRHRCALTRLAVLALHLGLAQHIQASEEARWSHIVPGPRWRSNMNRNRAQAYQCYEQLARLSTTRDPAAVLPSGVDRTAWASIEQRRLDVVAALDKWHAEHGSDVTEGHTGQLSNQQQFYLALGQIPCVETVCEIGFNGGHSAAVWMSARPDIRLVSFDLGMHPYAFNALQFYAKNYPGRITATFGDSSKTVPQLVKEVGRICDLLVVDGGHSYEMASVDINNMAHMANPAFNIFVMDDVNCVSNWCLGPNKALQESVDSQLLSIGMRAAYTQNNVEVPLDSSQAARGFSFGTYNVTLPHHMHMHKRR